MRIDVRYQILVAIEVDAPSDAQARDWAVQLEDLMRDPILQLTLAGKGIQLSGDGHPVVYQPQRLPR